MARSFPRGAPTNTATAVIPPVTDRCFSDQACRCPISLVRDSSKAGNDRTSGILVSAGQRLPWIPESPSQNLCLITVSGGDLWDNGGMPSRPRRPVAKEPPQPAHAVLGYARVSTGHQVLDQQLDALAAAGVSGRVFTDTMSGTRDDRPGLAELMAYARAGDTVTVVALDRLGRSLSGIVQTVKTLGERGIVLRSLREGVDTSTSTGRMVLGIFASLADYERTLIAERAAAAREAARIRGRQVGRPSALTGEQVAMTVRMRSAGESVVDIGRTFGVGRSTLYRLWSSSGELPEAATFRPDRGAHR